MPWTIRKLPGKPLYRVRNAETGRIAAKAATKENALAQLNYLNSLYHNESLHGGRNAIKLEEFPEVNATDKGLYCFLAYDKIDKHGQAVFKIGITSRSFSNRVEGYHTYHPMGVYMVFFLKNPSKNHDQKPVKKFYEEIEQYIFKQVEWYGAYRLVTTTRHRPTEYFYAQKKELDNAFDDAQKKYGGELIRNDVKSVNKEAVKLKKQPHYTAEIVYPIPKRYLSSR